jgi:hypothetical protein
MYLSDTLEGITHSRFPSPLSLAVIELYKKRWILWTEEQDQFIPSVGGYTYRYYIITDIFTLFEQAQHNALSAVDIRFDVGVAYLPV